jgi:hypothetical protein
MGAIFEGLYVLDYPTGAFVELRNELDPGFRTIG